MNAKEALKEAKRGEVREKNAAFRQKRREQNELTRAIREGLKNEYPLVLKKVRETIWTAAKKGQLSCRATLNAGNQIHVAIREKVVSILKAEGYEVVYHYEKYDANMGDSAAPGWVTIENFNLDISWKDGL